MLILTKETRDLPLKQFFLSLKILMKIYVGIVRTWSALHDMDKHWLVTFNFAGAIIDYIPICEWPGTCSKARTMEAQINKDFTVNVQQLNFPENNYIIQFDSIKEILYT